MQPTPFARIIDSMVRSFAVLTAVIAVVAAFNRGESAEVTAQLPPAVKPVEAVGSVGCSATACHGKPDAKALTEPLVDADVWKSSATIFNAVDPHRKAYPALFTPEAAKIIAHLRKADPSYKAASEELRCLACHTTPSLADKSELRGEGVSCEACHGPASQWLASHTTWRTPESRSAPGFRDLRKEAAQTCAGCHIGDGSTPLRDMNHDMIAAGHPDLKHPALRHPYKPGTKPDSVWDTAFPTLLARLPRHWPEKHAPADDGKAFLAAAQQLSASRAARSPWPEFEEMECAKCHQGLRSK